MTFRTLLTVTGPNQGEGDLKLAADLAKRERTNWVEAEMAILTSTQL